MLQTQDKKRNIFLFANLSGLQLSGTNAKFYIKKSLTRWTASGTMLTNTR